MIRKTAFVALAVILILGVTMIVAYTYPTAEGGWTPGPFLVTLEITRHGQRTFQITELEDTPMTAINHDTGLAYGFVPSVVDRKTVSVGFYAMDYNPEEDAWELPEDAEPLETLEVGSRGPSFTKALDGSSNYKLNLVSIEPIKSTDQ